MKTLYTGKKLNIDKVNNYAEKTYEEKVFEGNKVINREILQKIINDIALEILLSEIKDKEVLFLKNKTLNEVGGKIKNLTSNLTGTLFYTILLP